jgi:D-sedoheptulose 7-phosphate isomerase
MNYIDNYLKQVSQIAGMINHKSVEGVLKLIIEVKSNGGRIFALGVGGSAANCQHLVNDLRKIVGIESYAPTDNVSELTARINDDGWDTVFLEWLKVSKLSNKDIVFFLSVGGGNIEKNISSNLVVAAKYAQKNGSKIVGIIGRDGGFVKEIANECILIPTVDINSVTPHSEAFQAVIWHMIVSHPLLAQHKAKWESVSSDER